MSRSVAGWKANHNGAHAVAIQWPKSPMHVALMTSLVFSFIKRAIGDAKGKNVWNEIFKYFSLKSDFFC